MVLRQHGMVLRQHDWMVVEEMVATLAMAQTAKETTGLALMGQGHEFVAPSPAAF